MLENQQLVAMWCKLYVVLLNTLIVRGSFELRDREWDGILVTYLALRHIMYINIRKLLT